MKELIRKFEKESKLEIFGLGARREIWEAALEKYAELIVRECCQKLEDDGMVEVAIEMKQHFGVEE